MIGKLAHNHMGEEPHIGLGSLDGMIGKRCRDHYGRRLVGTLAGRALGSLVYIDNEFPRSIFELPAYLHADLLKQGPGLGTALLGFPDIEEDLHPFQVLRDGNPARVTPIFLPGLFRGERMTPATRSEGGIPPRAGSLLPGPGART